MKIILDDNDLARVLLALDLAASDCENVVCENGVGATAQAFAHSAKTYRALIAKIEQQTA